MADFYATAFPVIGRSHKSNPAPKNQHLLCPIRRTSIKKPLGGYGVTGTMIASSYYTCFNVSFRFSAL